MSFLDPRQRLIFREWCISQADTCQKIADQIDSSLPGVGSILSKRERQKAAAFSIVAEDLAEEREQVSI